jgi:hypothetical protein
MISESTDSNETPIYRKQTVLNFQDHSCDNLPAFRLTQSYDHSDGF